MAWLPFKRRRHDDDDDDELDFFRGERGHRRLFVVPSGSNIYPPRPNLPFVNTANINMPTEPFVDSGGRLNRSWWRFLQQLRKDVNGLILAP